MIEKDGFSATTADGRARQIIGRLLRGPEVKHLLPLYAAGAVLALLLPLVLGLDTSMRQFCCFIAWALAMIGFWLSISAEAE